MAAKRDQVPAGGRESVAAAQGADILQRRALELARPPGQKQSTGKELKAVEFLLAEERYAIESRLVREIASLREITPLPCLPPFVLGVINLRGEILSVLDIKRFFNLPSQGLGDLNKMVVLHLGKMTFAILADEIVGTRKLDETRLERALPTHSRIRTDYLRGVSAEGIMVLDGEKLLSDPAIVVHETVS